MDLHFTTAIPSDDERQAIDAFFSGPAPRWEPGGHEARRNRQALLPALHALVDRFGWISEGALNYICRRLTIPPADAYGVASFYGLFTTQPRSKTMVHVCDDIACMAAGAEKLCAALEGKLDQSLWQRSPCLGLCDRAPAALVIAAGEEPRAAAIAPATASAVAELSMGPSLARSATLDGSGDSTNVTRTVGDTTNVADRASRGPIQSVGKAKGLRLLRRIGRIDPASVDDYRAAGGYVALRRALDLGPNGVIREVTESKLVGRGGAAFPTGRKWEAVAREPEHPHYLICNADESEPGTFKDRILMEGDPFALLEAMTIAAYAGGCERGYIYIRGEYPGAIEVLQLAAEIARAHGLLGDDLMGRGLRFDVEIRRGAGAYIAGEETALFNSIEGYRPEPRNKPPFPVQRGLFGKPTIVNNVETLVNVLEIVMDGGRAFAATGTADSTGTKLFCVSGHVARPGLYEIPFGVPVRELIDLAGGVRQGRRIQAVLLGGAAGTFLRPDELDMRLSFEGARAAGASLGSGVVFVLDDSADLRRYLVRIAAFFREESCGQCVPCRVGTVRQQELLHRMVAQKPLGSAEQERALLGQIGQVMRDASICGLGQTASSAIESALGKFAL